MKKAVKKVTKKSAKAKRTAKSATAKKRKKPAAPYTAKFSPKPLNERERAVLLHMVKRGPSSLQQIGDTVFKNVCRGKKRKRLTPSERNSWARNCMRTLRGHRAVSHTPRKGDDKPAIYSATKTAAKLLKASA